MSKEKQIEEMAKLLRPITICFHCRSSLNDDGKRDGGCYYSGKDNCPHGALIMEYCNTLYNAGYRKQNSWISVEDRLPDKYKSVLISCEDEVRIDWIDAFGFWHDNYPYRVTHWMPLPEAPKMKGE